MKYLFRFILIYAFSHAGYDSAVFELSDDFHPSFYVQPFYFYFIDLFILLFIFFLEEIHMHLKNYIDSKTKK